MGLNINIFKCFGLKFNKSNNFHTLEVVNRGSDTQLRVGENSNDLIYLF